VPSVNHSNPRDTRQTTMFWAACLLGGLVLYAAVSFVGTTAAVQHDWGTVGFLCLAASLPTLFLLGVVLNILFPSIPLRQTFSLVLLTSMWAPIVVLFLAPVLLAVAVATALSSVLLSPLLYIVSPLVSRHRSSSVSHMQT
jgi:hypothetical protein